MPERSRLKEVFWGDEEEINDSERLSRLRDPAISEDLARALRGIGQPDLPTCFRTTSQSWALRRAACCVLRCAASALSHCRVSCTSSVCSPDPLA